MKQGKYWEKRFKKMEEAQNDTSLKKNMEIQELFDRSLYELDKKIRVWYQRLADNNGVSMVEAKKLLSNKELKEFRWSLEEYIQHAKDNELGQYEKELENASARVHIGWLEALKVQVQAEMERVFGNYTDSIDQHILDLYNSEYYHTAFEIQKGIGVGSQIQALNKAKVESIIRNPWAVDEQSFSDRIWKDKKRLINTVHQSLTKMCITGDSPDTAIKEIQTTMNTTKRNASRLVMTESAVFANKARKECMENLGVQEFEVIETLDGITCPKCGSMDGKHFSMSEYVVGVTAPPFHPNCRGCTCPYFDDEFTVGEERVARNEEGKTYNVPANMTYEEWKQSFVEDGSKKKFNDSKGFGSNDDFLGIPEHKDYEIIDKIDFNNENMVKSVLDKFEKDAVNESIETACIISKDGTVYKCYGVKDRVFPDADLGDALYGSKVSHNHPIEETTFTFSTDDADLFIEYNLELLRGCDEEYTYEFTRDASNIDDYEKEWMTIEGYSHNKIIEYAKEKGIGYRRWKNE